MRRVTPSPASIRYSVPLTTSRLDVCARSLEGSGPPRVPRVISVVSADAWFAATTAIKPASSNDMPFTQLPLPLLVSGRVTILKPSWPGLSRPSTPCLRDGKDVDARHKAGHDEIVFGAPGRSDCLTPDSIP